MTDPDVQAISNFVDQDPTEGGILDWDCTNLAVSMDTREGNKVSATIKIIGVAGLVCVD